MKQALNYNLYNILKFQIIRDKGYGFRDLINLKLSSFLVDEIDQPDIILNIGKFSPSPEGCYLVDYKYHIRDNYFYCRDSEGKASWEVEIAGLEQGDTIINFNVHHRFGLQSIINPDLLPQTLLLRIMEYKFATKGYWLIHSAAISKDNQAYLLCGRGSSFKTTLCMDSVRRAGFDCLGDDRIILHQGKALSFWLHPSLFQFMTEHLTDEKCFGALNQARYIKHLWHGDYKAENQRAKSAELKALLFITTGNGQDRASLTFEPIAELEPIVSRLVVNNRLEDFTYQIPAFGVDSAPFLRYMLAYSFVFPHSRIATYEAELSQNLMNTLTGIPIYCVDLPLDYNPEVFSQVHQFIANHG